MRSYFFTVPEGYRPLIKQKISEIHHQRLLLVVPVFIALGLVFIVLDFLAVQQEGLSAQLMSYLIQDHVFLFLHVGLLLWLFPKDRKTPDVLVYLYLGVILLWAVFSGNIEYQRTGGHTTVFLAVLTVSSLGVFSVPGILWIQVATLTTYAAWNALSPGPVPPRFEQFYGLIALPFLSFAVSRTLYAATVRNVVANHQLEQANKELKEARLNLIRQDKMASLGVLAAGIAHEISTPLALIKGHGAALEKTVLSVADPSLQAEGQAALEETREGFRRIGEVVQALATFARELPPGETAPYDLNLGVQTTLVMTRHEAAGIVVDTDLADLPLVPARGSEVNQVLLNLLMNAYQAVRSLPAAEVRLVMVRTRREEDSVVAEVSNTGPAIPAEIREKIFEPFFSTKGPGLGMGLGLSLGWQIIVNRHRGELELLEKEPVTFRLRLPLR